MTGMGCKAAYSVTSPVSWIEIGDVVDFGLPKATSDRVEKTVHSRLTRLRKTEPGLESVEDAFVEVIQDLSSAAQKALRDYKTSRTKIWFLFEIPCDDEFTTFVTFYFQGRVADFQSSNPKDGEQISRYSFQFDGEQIVETAPGSAVSMS